MIDRRELFKGLTLGAGAAVLGPVASKLHAEAAGKELPRRVVFFIEGNGCQPHQVQPEGITRLKEWQRDKLITKSLADQELPTALEPVKAFKDRMTIIQGLSGKVCGGGHSNNFGALGCYSSKAGPAGETADLAIARALGGVYPHVGLGITDRPENSLVYNISAFGARKPAPTQCRPDLAHATLFGSAAEGDARKRFAAQGHVLDFLAEDAGRMGKHLAGPEREKLQNYLHAFEGMRGRQEKLAAMREGLAKAAPKVTPKYTSEVETDRLEMQVEIATASLVAGLTNTVTLSSGAGDQYFGIKFDGLGIGLGKHAIGHGGSYMGRGADELSTTIRRWHFGLVNRLAETLDRVPEGDGTMLDNTLIIYMSDAAEGHHSRCSEWPVVLIGDLGGRLKTRGRYLEYPAHLKRGNRTMSNFFTTVLGACGLKGDTFGTADPLMKDFDQKGPLAELL